MRSLLHSLILAPALMAAATLPTAAATAERAVIPFSFTVNGKECPAGVYTLDKGNLSSIVMLRSVDAHSHFIWTLGLGDPRPSDTRVILTFDVVGQNHFLRTIQYRNMITSRLDRKDRSMELASLEAIAAQ